NRTNQTNEPTWIGERVHKDMNECILCGGETVFSLSASFIFSFKPFPASIKCHDCLSKLVLLKKHPTCPGCCRRQTNRTLCQYCIRWKRRYLTDSFNHLALYAYNEPMKEWLEQYKFHGDIRQAHAFSEEIKESLKPFIK